MPPKAKQDDAADAAVTMADAAALTGAAVAESASKPKRPAPFMSEGMRDDLETLGWAVDPVSGARFDRDPETGEVTVTERASGV